MVALMVAISLAKVGSQIDWFIIVVVEVVLCIRHG
jgi:hypothetical protein